MDTFSFAGASGEWRVMFALQEAEADYEVSGASKHRQARREPRPTRFSFRIQRSTATPTTLRYSARESSRLRTFG